MLLENISSPTYSINQNALKLNSSSVASSAPNSSDIKGPYVYFEQYKCQENIQKCRINHAKKKLTIQIDENFDFQPISDMNHDKIDKQISQTPTSMITNDFNNNLINEMTEKIELLQEKLLVCEQSKKEKCVSIQKIQKQKSQLLKQNDILKQQLKKKDEIINSYQIKNDELIYKVAQLDELRVQDRYYDQKLREKQMKVKQLQKLYDKILSMNKVLQKDLRQSDKKIMQLQKQIQKNIYTVQYQNITKIKESSVKLKESNLKLKQIPVHTNKQNSTYNGAKSLDKKKLTTNSQGKKTGRAPSSSTTNFNKKLQIKV